MRRYSTARAGATGHGSSHVRTSRSRRPPAARGLLRGGRSSTAPPSRPGARRTAAAPPTSRAAPWKRSTLPVAAALRHQPPAGPQRRVQAGEQRVVVGHPVEHGVGEGGVHRLVELELGQVGLEHGGAVVQVLRAPARPSRARRRPPSRGRAGRRSSSSLVTRPLPQPASSTVSSPSSGSRSSTFRGPLRLGRGDAVVGRARPSRAWSRERVVTGPGRSRSPSYAAIASSDSSVTPMSSRPSSSRRLVSGSISNANVVAAGAHHLALQVHLGLVLACHQRLDLVLGQRHRQQPDLGAVGVEDVGERLGDDAP